MSEYLQSELPAIELFKKLNYDYFDAKGEMYEVVLEDRLYGSLKRINPWLNENNLQKAVRKILAISGSSLMEINSELFLELSELLERKIRDAKIDHKQAVHTFFTEMEEIITRHKSRHLALGLNDEKQLLVYDVVKNSALTLEIFDVLDAWLHKHAVLIQSDAQKEMRNAIKPLLAKHGLERKLSKNIVALLVKTYA